MDKSKDAASALQHLWPRRFRGHSVGRWVPMGRRLRRLHVEGQLYAWTAEIGHVQGEQDCHRCLRLRIWGDGKNSRPLQVDLLSKAWPAPWGACATDGSYPTSADVLAVITRALSRGWQPAARGGVYLLTEQEHAAHFDLPGFLITDRPTDPNAPDPSARVIHAYRQRAGGGT